MHKMCIETSDENPESLINQNRYKIGFKKKNEFYIFQMYNNTDEFNSKLRTN